MTKILLILFLVLSLSVFSQQNKIDSLEKVLLTTKEDTNKVNLLNQLFVQYEFKDIEKATKYLNTALELSEKINYKKGLAVTYSYFGFLAEDTGSYPQAIAHYKQSLKISNEINDKKGISSSLGTIGISYDSQGDYPNALEYYFKALKIAEETRDTNLMSVWLGNIANIHKSLGEFSKALEYGFKSLKMREQLGNKNHIAIQLGNIGLIYYNQADSARGTDNTEFMQEKYQKALEYNFKSLKMREELGAKNLISSSLGNIGNVYKSLAETALQNNRKSEGDSLYQKAFEYYFKGLNINEQLGKKIGIAISLGNIGALYIAVGKYNEAEKYLQHGLAICDSIGALNEKRQLEKTITGLYEQTNQTAKAYEHYKKYIAAKDSIYNAENTKKNVRTEMNFEFEKKEAVAKETAVAAAALAAAESRKQKIIIWAVAGGLLLVLVFSIFIYRGYKQKQKANLELERKNNEILNKKKEIEEQKNEILSSIRYAKRIQNAMLKEEKKVTAHLPDHFVLFKPKDIVSGDFYWATEKKIRGHELGVSNFSELSERSYGVRHSADQTPNSELIWYVAAADCTGHGVPGAFLTMLGMSFLNEITITSKLLHPSEILDELRKRIIKELGQTGKEGDSKDGMDISLMALNLQTLEIEWAGANNSLNFIQNGELKEIKANKQPVGYFPEPKPFTNHRIQLQKGDTVYIFTDGYADQFGGPKGKKFRYSQFEKLLVSIQEKSMTEQREILSETIDKWKGELEQIDDICIIGVKI